MSENQTSEAPSGDGAGGTAVWPYALPRGDRRHGTNHGYTNLGCRCPACGAARYEAMHRGLPRGSDLHGTYTGYRNHGCRCAKCRRANVSYQRERGSGGYTTDACACGARKYAVSRMCDRCNRAANAAEHGSESMYNGGRCRCAPCREAATAARRARRQAVSRGAPDGGLPPSPVSASTPSPECGPQGSRVDVTRGLTRETSREASKRVCDG